MRSFLSFITEGVVKRLWHLTSDPHFVPDPKARPELNSLAGDLIEHPPAGLFVTDMPEYWMQAHNYERPYVAEIEGEAVRYTPKNADSNGWGDATLKGTLPLVSVDVNCGKDWKTLDGAGKTVRV